MSLKRAALSCVVATLAAPSVVATEGYTLQNGWPSAMPQLSTQLSAVGVDPYVVGGTEIYVAQRGPNLTEPILVFNETGSLLRSFGSSNIKRDDTSGSWGCHGLSVKSSLTEPTQIWINDFVDYTTKVFDAQGKLLAVLGDHGDPGASVDPIQFDKVADTAFGSDDAVYISDGDGSSNHRVVAVNGSGISAIARGNKRHEHLRGKQRDAVDILWVGGNNNTPSAFSDTVDGHSLASMHSVAHHPRTNTLLAIDRENNRTLHVDATHGKVLGEWTMEDLVPNVGSQSGFETFYGVRTFYSPKYDKDFILFAVGDMDATDHPIRQGVFVVDAASVTASGPGDEKKVLQQIDVDHTKCWTPHLLGMNGVNGDMYVACVGANSAVWRYTYSLE